MSKQYDTIVVGGGFYGLRIAQFLVEELGQKRRWRHDGSAYAKS